MEETKSLAWHNLVTSYNLDKKDYGEGEIYYFPPHWSNGWIVEMNPNEGLYVSSIWFKPDEKIVHKLDSQLDAMWIVCVDSGNIGITQQGKQGRYIRKTTDIVVNPKKPFTWTFNKHEHYCFTSVMVTQTYIDRVLQGVVNPPNINVRDCSLWESDHLNTANIMLIMEQIRWAIRNGDISLFAYGGMVNHLLSSIARNYPKIPKRRSSRRNYVTWENEQKIYKVKEAIDRDVLKVQPVEEMCKLAEMSESKLREGFKNIYHIPLYQYIRRETMKIAMQLLSGDHLSIGDIAEICGFKNPSKFTEAFKDVHGIAPSEFRRAFNL